MPSESRLAEIYRQELKNKGLISALISASAERRKERNDIRRMLPQSGVMGAAFQHAFGKPYRYGSSGSGVRDTRGPSDVATSKSVEEKITRLGVDMKIMAKNSVVLPAMARDMNLMRMNMQKMVKLSGGTPSMKADMFFKRAADRESSYESQYGRAGGTSPLSASSGKTGSGIGSFFGGIFSLLGGALSGAGSILSALIPSISGFFGALIKAIVAAGVIGLALSQLSPETREALKKFFVDALAGFFNAVRDGFKYIKDLMTDPKVVESFQGAIQELVGAIVAAFKLALSTPIKTPLGEYTLGGILATTVIALAAFKGAVFAATAALLGMGGGRGGNIPTPGAPGDRKGGGMGRTGKLAFLLGLGLTMKEIYDMFGGKEKAEAALGDGASVPMTPGSPGYDSSGAPIVPSAPPSNANPTSPERATTGQNVLTGAGLALETWFDAAVIKYGLSKFPSMGTTPSAPPSASAGRPLTDFGSVGERREMAKNRSTYEKIARLIKKIGEKIGVRALTGFIWSRLKWSIAAKLTAVVAGVVAAPFSAGASLVITALGAGLLAYDLYQIVDFLTTLAKEVGVDEGESSSPQRVESTQAAADVVPPSSPAPVPAAAPGGNTSTTPMPVSYPGSASDATSERIAAGESGGKYDTVYGKAGGALINGKLVTQNTVGEIIAWQKSMQSTNRHAVGKYGFINVESIAQKGNIPLNSLFDAAMQERLYGVFRERNRSRLRQLGIEVSPFSEMAAHSVGPDGYSALLRANPNANAADVLGLTGAGRSTNPHLNKPVSQVFAAWANKVNQPAPPPVMVATAPSGGSNIPPADSAPVPPASTKPTETPLFAGTGNALMDIFAGYLTYREEYMKKSGAPAQIAINSGNSTVNQGGGGTGGQSVSPYNDDMMKYLLKPVT